MKLFITTDYGIREFQYYDGTPINSDGLGYLEFFTLRGTQEYIYKVRVKNLNDCIYSINKSISLAGEYGRTALIIDSDKLTGFNIEKDGGGYVYVTTDPRSV